MIEEITREKYKEEFKMSVQSVSNNIFSKSIDLAIDEFNKKHGDVQLENDDEFVTVFNDGVLIIGAKDNQLTIKYILGKPFKVDFDLNMLQCDN